MDVLACKRMEGTKTGRILMNGQETSPSFRKQIGYCTQVFFFNYFFYHYFLFDYFFFYYFIFYYFFYYVFLFLSL